VKDDGALSAGQAVRVRTALLLSTLLATSAGANQPLWIWFDDDGTPVISDRRDHPGAEPYRVGTFDEIALRQQNEPHRGLGGGWAEPPAVPDDVLAVATAAARKHGVERALVLAVIGIESGFNPGAVSRVGARGLMQLMPATADDLGVDPADPRENVDGGTRYLAWLLNTFGDRRLALAGYNAGPGRVKRAGNRIPAIRETEDYVRAVMALFADFRRAGM
jgi:hypothetical protein